jgi:hypothetical protein
MSRPLRELSNAELRAIIHPCVQAGDFSQQFHLAVAELDWRGALGGEQADHHVFAFHMAAAEARYRANKPDADRVFRAERRAERRKAIWLGVQLFAGLFALASSLIVAGRIVDNALVILRPILHAIGGAQ